MNDQFDNLVSDSPIDRLKIRLNGLSHESFIIRAQLETFCKERDIKTSKFGSDAIGMDIFHDVDYSCIDNDGKDKRFVITLESSPLGTRELVKNFTRKLTNIYCYQQNILSGLTHLKYMARYDAINEWKLTTIARFNAENLGDR